MLPARESAYADQRNSDRMTWKIGVCSWSLDRHDPLRAIELAAEINLRTIQLGLFTEECMRQADFRAIRAAAAAADVVVHSTFAAFEREDYSSIASIAATGGFRCDTEYAHRLEMTRLAADLTQRLGCRALAVHVGTIPIDQPCSDYQKLLGRTGEVAAMLADRKLELWIESGREPADVLIAFIQKLALPNVRINFDPGNFVVYGTGEPPQLVAPMMPMIGGVHMKDGVKSARPGVEFGKPAVLGAGDAQIPRVISKLRALGFAGPLFLEMSGREDQRSALRSAAAYLHTLLA